VRLESSTKPHVHQKFEIFWTNIASAMGCPNSKNMPKKGLRPLGVKNYKTKNIQFWTRRFQKISFMLLFNFTFSMHF
jgi:hypothetical protein